MLKSDLKRGQTAAVSPPSLPEARASDATKLSVPHSLLIPTTFLVSQDWKHIIANYFMY